MGSANHPRIYDPATLAIARDAFYDVWAELEVNDRPHIRLDDGLKAEIVSKLLELVSEGTTERAELRAEVLRQIAR
jgi:hypothetical protein